MGRNNFSNKIFSIILSFLLSILFFGILTIIGIYTGAFHKNFILDKLKESNYYDESYKAFQKEVEILLKESGIPIAIIEETYSKKRFAVSQRNNIQDLLRGKISKTKEDSLKEEIQKNLESNFKKEGLSVNGEISSGLSEIIIRTEEVYDQKIAINFLNDIWKYRDKFVKLTILLLPCIITVGALIIAILWQIYQPKHRALRFVSYGILGASIMEAGVSALLLRYSDYGSLLTEEGYYKKFIELYMKGSFQALYFGAAIGVLLFIVVLILIKLLKNHAGFRKT